MTLSPPIIGVIIFAVLAGSAFAGWGARQRLPTQHLNDETKSLVSVSMAVVGTITALVLGLLISNANTSFIARNGEVTTLSADILRLDQMLRLAPDPTLAVVNGVRAIMLQSMNWLDRGYHRLIDLAGPLKFRDRRFDFAGATCAFLASTVPKSFQERAQ